MFNMLETNCPNCGGTLLDSGKCPYCGTIVRYANELSLDISEYGYIKHIEIKLMIKKGDAVTIIPLKGHINTITTIFEPVHVECTNGKNVLFNNNGVRYNIDFEGYVDKSRLGGTHEQKD